MTRNSNRHYEISTSDGQVWTETARNSFGSYCQMMRRIEGTIDQGVTFTVEEVFAL